MMQWDKYLKRYTWDDTRTPYLVPVHRLSRTQAEYETFAYAFFLMVLFGVIGVAAYVGRVPQGKSVLLASYAFSVLGAAVLFGLTKHLYAALYCAAVPVVALLYFFFQGFPPKLALIDELVLLIFLAMCLRYSRRIIAISLAFDSMPEKPESS
jgi:hypothetical protein